jgi:hypothetical protein
VWGSSLGDEEEHRTQLQRHAYYYQHSRVEASALFGMPFDDYADDDDTASDFARRRVRAPPRQHRRDDPVEDWCDMDDSSVQVYGEQWGIAEAMGELGGGSTAVW